MKNSYYLFQDWRANANNSKGKVILVLYRIAALSTKNKFLSILLIPYLLFYRIFVEWILGIGLPYKTKIGAGLKLFHGQALVINEGTIIGANCLLRHSTTVGNIIYRDGTVSQCPIIGDNVEVGANVCILGPISIGDHTIIAAGSIVIRNVPNNCMVAGNPAEIKRYINETI
jgi:putative colanic acid biosynthesis acetyltransferase WcaB